MPPGAGDLSLPEALKQYGSFDEEILPRIRADRVHEAQVPFVPTDRGRYQILVTALEDGEEQIIGQVDLDVVETPSTPTPTPTLPPLPTATPVHEHGSDEGCAMSAPSDRTWGGTIVLLFVPVLIGFLRARRRG